MTAPVANVLRHARMTLDDLHAVVAENNKTRYELTADGQRIRASQGHSLAGTPHTLIDVRGSTNAGRAAEAELRALLPSRP